MSYNLVNTFLKLCDMDRMLVLALNDSKYQLAVFFIWGEEDEKHPQPNTRGRGHCHDGQVEEEHHHAGHHV